MDNPGICSKNVTSIAGVPCSLKHILKATGAGSVLDIWPNLELFIHGGVIPYREQFQVLYPFRENALP